MAEEWEPCGEVYNFFLVYRIAHLWQEEMDDVCLKYKEMLPARRGYSHLSAGLLGGIMMQVTPPSSRCPYWSLPSLLSLLRKKKGLFPFWKSIFSRVDYCLLGRTEGTNPLM